jgi:hypothetical protein
VNADGTEDTLIRGGGGAPAWSPDGSRIVFTQIYDCGPFCPSDPPDLWVMDADGSDPVRLAGTAGAMGPASWGPNGKIAFSRLVDDVHDIHTVNPDGTDLTRIAGSSGWDPDWSPDGTRLVFNDFADNIYVMDRDGSNRTQLTATGKDRHAVWSPDGRKIAFSSWIDPGSSLDRREVHVMNSDGSGRARLTFRTTGEFSGDQASPTWQPVPYTGYARPRAASPMRVSLVPTYRPCNDPDRVPPNGAANRTHGPPLAYPSCNPPVMFSVAKVGTADSTALAANSVGIVRYRTIVGVPGGVDDADLAITVDVTDVLCRPLNAPEFPTCGAENSDEALPEDYVGELRATVGVRITDRDNGGSAGAGTVSDTDFSVTVPCVETPDVRMGSACSVTTTADAVVPGAIKEGQRAVWQLGQVTVFDGGPDGDAETPAGEEVFLRQGIFIP